ncbi:hypothetical protein ACIO3O_37380 [Streptomyces sp. NPDC087440]|uniref:hypothetical protein n=1 Tax=Streptomyces sp. NPDC087440 TaxID=3365790 RepID=UPI00382089CD
MNPLDPRGAPAQRFPLVPRQRPACLPLPARLRALTDLADRAVGRADPVLASTTHNQAALLASDLALPDLARDLCHQHARALLGSCPLPAKGAIRALEPLVNLARLQIRAQQGQHGHHLLLDLYEAVRTGTSVTLDDITVPANLTATAKDRHTVCEWLWRVLLGDGTRAFTSGGRWAEALAHLQEHKGVGMRMLDGRQVAVIAALTASDASAAAELLETTAPGELWEQAVAACLTALLHPPDKPAIWRLIGEALTLETEPGTAVFHIRLRLTILDLAGDAREHEFAARRVVDGLHRFTMWANDGYAARESLSHPVFNSLATEQQRADCRALVTTCALGTGQLLDREYAQLMHAVHASGNLLRNPTHHA